MRGIANPLKSLNDSGAAIAVISRKALQGIKPEVLGSVRLRSAFNDDIPADLAKIDVRVCDENVETNTPSQRRMFVPITVAVVDKLSEQFILPESTVNELQAYSHYWELPVCSVESNKTSEIVDCDPSTLFLDSDNNLGDDLANNHDDNAKLLDENVNDDNRTHHVETINSDLIPEKLMVVDSAKRDALKIEQISDPSLKPLWHLAKLNKGGYFIKDDLLFHKDKVEGLNVDQLVIPSSRREQIIDLAHKTLTGGHCRVQRTRQRI